MIMSVGVAFAQIHQDVNVKGGPVNTERQSSKGSHNHIRRFDLLQRLEDLKVKREGTHRRSIRTGVK